MENHIHVVDSPVGSGKTTWAIFQIDHWSSPDDKFIFVTPYLDECTRIIKSSKRNFIEPESKKGKGRKSVHFKKLLKDRENIVTTHSLFSSIDDEIIDLIKEGNYTLILDECFDVLNRYDLYEDTPRYKFKNKDNLNLITNNDISLFKNDGYIEVEQDYKIVWKKDEYYNKYDSFKKLVDRELLYFVHNEFLIWGFPVDVFRKGVFKYVYIFTFMFEYQVQYYYYKYHNITYEKYHIELTESSFDKDDEPFYNMVKTENDIHEKEWKATTKSLITIFEDDNLNSLGSVYINTQNKNIKSALCKSWYDKNTVARKEDKVQLRNNAYNYFRNHSSFKKVGKDIMWTTFKKYKKEFVYNQLSKKNFVSLNTRATNDYRHKKSLAYLINRYMIPYYEHFFKKRDIPFDQDGWALSELIQWIFRSRIRDNEPIDIYIPSERMRTLLINYLDGKEVKF